MKRTQWLQEIKKMRFEEAYTGWSEHRLTQKEAAILLSVHERTFRRYIARYKEEGLEGLLDKRLTKASHRRAPVDEVMNLEKLYCKRYSGWNVKHFYSFYRRKHEGGRSYTWVKNKLQEAKLVKKAPGRGKHRKRRERSPLPGMMIHQDGSTHEWVPDKKWDLIVTMDDATSEHYSMFFVDEEGTTSSFLGVQEVIEQRGLFCSMYTDRGSHYWHTPEAGGKVDKANFTQFGRAMHQLGIEMIAAYSPEARGRSERAFETHQGRLPNELAAAGITDMESANRYIREEYKPAFNDEFMVPALDSGSGFVSLIGHDVTDILCEHYERTVGKNNCVSFEGRTLQILPDQHRMNYIKVKVRVHRYLDGNLAIFHGPRRLADYNKEGEQIKTKNSKAA